MWRVLAPPAFYNLAVPGPFQFDHRIEFQPADSDEILRAAFGAVTAGADAVITGRSYDIVRMLANEQIPVMGHLGFVPRKSTWVGSVRAVGKTSMEALELWDRFRRLEDAGAFAVECEVIAAAVMAEINRRTVAFFLKYLTAP